MCIFLNLLLLFARVLIIASYDADALLIIYIKFPKSRASGIACFLRIMMLRV